MVFYTTRLFGIELLTLGIISIFFIVRDYLNSNWFLFTIGIILTSVCFFFGIVVLFRKFQKVTFEEEQIVLQTIFNKTEHWIYKEIKYILGTKSKFFPIYTLVKKDDSTIRFLFFRNKKMIRELIRKSPEAVIDQGLKDRLKTNK
ncbi:hypothetical protein ACFSCX_21070 [Bacillus salitolerans]|uniref:Uncharacterized protein n=1 Tax=Bacillus salitolerans TaxID=1437434 RepID=A0ABW4LV09_9BACI